MESLIKNPVVSICTGMSGMGILDVFLNHELFSSAFIVSMSLFLSLIAIGITFTYRDGNGNHDAEGQRNGGGMMMAIGILSIIALCFLTLLGVVH